MDVYRLVIIFILPFCVFRLILSSHENISVHVVLYDNFISVTSNYTHMLLLISVTESIFKRAVILACDIFISVSTVISHQTKLPSAQVLIRSHLHDARNKVLFYSSLHDTTIGQNQIFL